MENSPLLYPNWLEESYSLEGEDRIVLSLLRGLIDKFEGDIFYVDIGCNDPIKYNNIPGCTYCSPEIASVGLSEKDAKDQGYELKIGKFPFSASGKASAAGHKEGFVKLIYDAKYGELLGAHMIGYNVTEMIAEIVAARNLETTGHEILKSIHPHPTMSEAVMEAAAAAYDEVIHM